MTDISLNMNIRTGLFQSELENNGKSESVWYKKK